MPFWQKLIFLICLLLLNIGNANAATDAGTAIVNQATLTYIDEATGQLVELKSNTSTILVAPLQQFELLSSNALVAIAGQSVSFSHTLSNIGNIDDRYLLSIENQLADSGDLINLMLYIDANDNGVVDADEVIVDGEIGIEAGESVSLVVTGVLPNDLNGNDEVEVVLYAQSVSLEQSVQTNTDLITVKPQAKLSLSLESNASCEVPTRVDESIELKLLATNASATLPDSREIEVDGQKKQGVLLEVILPTELGLIANEFLDVVGYKAIPIVQENSSDSNWMRYEHWTGDSLLSRFALLVPIEEFTENDIVSVAFLVSTKSQVETTQSFVNAGIDLNNNGLPDVEANAVCIATIGLGEAINTEIRFLEPTLELLKNERVPVGVKWRLR